MCDEWMSVVKLPITIDEFHQLPRHSAFKYEYFAGQAHLTPRPKFYHALLDLDDSHLPDCPSEISLQLLRENDLPRLEATFAAAFAGQQPFSHLDHERRLLAARQSLEKIRAGGDGPLFVPASFVAAESDKIIGAILITIMPDKDPSEWDSFQWLEPPPEDWLARRLGRPHITWVFVSPGYAGLGVGTTLLAEAVAALRNFGYKQLASTFLLGNESSMLWHWRNGFRLQSYPGSQRRLRRLFEQRHCQAEEQRD